MRKLYMLMMVLCCVGYSANAQNANWVWARIGSLSTAQAYVSTSSDNIVTDGAGNSYISGYISSDSMTLGNLGVRNAGSPFSNLFVAKYDPQGNIVWVQQTTGCYFSYGACIALDQGAQNVYISGRYGAFSNSTARFGDKAMVGQYQTMYLAKLEAATGTVTWVKSADVGSGQNTNTAFGSGVATYGTNSIYVSGYFQGTVTFGGLTLTARGGNDGYVAKYDNNGNVLWVKTVGAMYQQASNAAVTTDADGNVYTAGNYGQRVIIENDTFNGNNSMYIAKYDSMGVYKWSRGSGGSNNSYNGCTEMVADRNGNIYITGWFLNNTLTFGPYSITNTVGDFKVFVVKYDASGTPQWLKNVGVTYNSGGGPGICIDKDNNFYVAGSYGPYIANIGNFTLTATPSTGGTRDLYVAKFDANGTALWAKSAGGSSDDFGYDVGADDQGNAYTTGFFQSPSISFDNITLTPTVNSAIFIGKINGGGVPPVAAFTSSDTVVCAGATVTYTDQSTGAPNVWRWVLDGATPNNPTTQNTTVTYSIPGTYNARLVVTNSTGTDSLTKTAVIRVTATGDAGTLAANPDTVCAGSEVTLATTGSNGTIRWQSSGNGIAFSDVQGANGSQYTATGVQTIYYRAIAGTGTCADTSQPLQLVVNALPAPPVVTLADAIICANDSTQVCATSGFTAYKWNNNATTNCIYARNAGGYWVTGTDANGCSSESVHKSLAVYPAPSVSIIVQGDTLTSFGAEAYQWYYNGSPIQGATASTYIAQQAGQYAVEITDNNGCQSISTPVQVGAIGIGEVDALQGVAIYPNPATDVVYITMRDAKAITEVRLVNMLGQEVIRQLVQLSANGKLEINLANLPSGAYQVVLYNGAQLIGAKRLVH